MEYVDGSSAELLSPSQAAAINTSGAWSSERRVWWSSQLVLETLMLLMCVCTVTGNTLVIIVVAATKTFHSVTSVLIMNLAVSDLLVGVGVMPFVAVSVFNSEWMNCTVLCVYVGYTSSVYCTASVLTLAAIALDRYHSIMNCLYYSSRCTRWRTCAVVLWIWFQALVTSFPPLLGWSSISYSAPMHSCAVNWAASPSYTTLMATLSYFTPAAVIIFCYVNIVRVARSHARRIHILQGSVQHSRVPSYQRCGNLHSITRLICHFSGWLGSSPGTEPRARDRHSVDDDGVKQSVTRGPRQNLQQHNRGMLRLFMGISAFLLCWTPHTGVALVQATETALSGRSTLTTSSAVTFSYWLLLLNSGINPLLYSLLSKRFQNALQGLRHKIGGTCKVGEGHTGGDDIVQSIHSEQPNTSDKLTSEISKCSSSIFIISSDFKHCSQSVFSTNSLLNKPSVSTG